MSAQGGGAATATAEELEVARPPRMDLLRRFVAGDLAALLQARR